MAGFSENRGIPVKAVSYDEGTGVLGFLPAGDVPAGAVVIRDDGERFETTREGDWVYATTGGWSKFILAAE